MLGRFATARFGVIMGMVISCALIIALVCVLTLTPAQSSLNLNKDTDSQGEFNVEQVDDTYTPSKSATSDDYPSTAAKQGTVTYDYLENSYYMLTATAYTTVDKDSYVFAYWRDSTGAKISGDNTIKVKSYTTSNNIQSREYVPVFIQEYNSSHVATGKVQRVTNLSTAISEKATSSNNYGAGMIFILENDINMSGSNNTPIGTNQSGATPYPFAGVIDGAGHKVENFKALAQSASSYAQNYFGGIVCYLNGGVIKNLTIVSGEITATSSSEVGAFAGRIKDGLISRCVNHAKVTGQTSGGMAGGMVGKADLGSNTSNGFNGGRSSALYYNENYGSITANYVGAVIYENTKASVSNPDGSTTQYPACYLIKNINQGSYQTTV